MMDGISETRVCPTCSRSTNDPGERFCVEDGTPLPHAADPLGVGQTIDGRYEITGVLGRGGMGTVYRATQVAVGRDVAVKVLNRALAAVPEASRRFFAEATAVSRLRHPNAVTLFDFGQTLAGLLYMVMEVLEGETLAKAIDRDGPMPLGRVLRIAGQISDALAEAHECGVVHRDLKPENVVLLQPRGHPDLVKVFDFGIARVAAGNMAATTPGIMSGTPAYMSPEAVQGESVDGRADIYALGVMLFELLAGRQPYVAETPFAVLVKHVSDPVPALPLTGVPERLAALVQSMMAKDRADRPESFVAVRQALDACLDGPPLPRRRSRRPWHTDSGAPSDLSADRRRHPRQARLVPVTLCWSGGQHAATLIDVSVTGAYVATRVAPPLGTHVDIVVSRSVSVGCVVVRTVPAGRPELALPGVGLKLDEKDLKSTHWSAEQAPRTGRGSP